MESQILQVFIEHRYRRMHHTFYGAASITTSQRAELIKKVEMPGPGAYDPAKELSSRIPEWTLKPKIQFTSCFHSHNSFVPAPGSYNIEPPIPSVPMQVMQPDAKANQQRNNKIIRYKDKNTIEKSSSMIALQIPSFVDQQHGFSFGYRDPVIVHETSPGPIYNVNLSVEESRKKKVANSSKGFGFGERSKIEKLQTPGPGNYETSTDKLYASAGKWTFSKSQRKDKAITDNPTSPGAYDPQVHEGSRGFKLKGRHPEPKSQFLDLSPMSYNLPDTKSKKGVIFNKNSASKSKNSKNLQETPSPFSYNISNTLKPGGFSLGKKLRSSFNSTNPGPGTYVHDTTLNEIGGFISKMERQKKKVVEGDNFYKYTPKLNYVNYKSPEFTFKQGRSSQENTHDNLGPGSYTFDKPSVSSGFTIARNIRFKPLEKQKNSNEDKTLSNEHLTGFIPGYLKIKKRNPLTLSSRNKENICDNSAPL